MKVVLDTSRRKADMEAAAKKLRDELEVTNIEWPVGSGIIWQVRDKDRDRMQRTIDTARAIEAPPEMTVGWIIADDTTRQTTAADLQMVLAAYTMRMSEIFTAYNAWRAAGITAPFTGNLT